jgi:hypothetical protein
VSDPALVVRVRRLRAARGVVVARDMTLAHALCRGNAQRALVAQALLADPDLLILDEPSGGMDADGVSRVAAEIRRAAGRRAVVLVARHPTAPLPLPSGLTWRLLTAVALYLVLFIARGTPMTPLLLRLSTHTATLQTPVGSPASWLFVPGLTLMATAAFLSGRLT